MRLIPQNILLVCALLLSSFTSNAAHHNKIHGITQLGDKAITHTTQEIMNRTYNNAPLHKKKRIIKRLHTTTKFTPQNPYAPAVSRLPHGRSLNVLHDAKICDDNNNVFRQPQALGLSFTAATLNDGEAFPPDTMGAVGPTQFILAINNKIESFDKFTGIADGALNVSPNIFFSSVSGGQSTTDIRIRYDRLSSRWFMIMTTEQLDRVMFAVSSDKIITGSTTWTFFVIMISDPINFDQPTLGIDANALYVGGVTFDKVSGNQDPNATRCFVINKASILGAGPIQYTTFLHLIDPITQEGPYLPHGVDNFDPNATTGYFISPANEELGKLILLKVDNPASMSPTLSSFEIIVPQTQNPIRSPHKGNDNGFDGELDAGDDTRCINAQILNNRLWTTQGVGVTNLGVCPVDPNQVSRDAARWYEIDVAPTNPVIVQAGTLFTPSNSNDPDERNFLYPSIMISGQGHMALGSSTAGTQEFANAAAAGRLVSDPLGLIQDPTLYTDSTTAYNPPADTGSAMNARRWGDYSYTSLDPCDNMTMWTIQEFCSDTDIWGVRVVKLLAPVPAQILQATPSVVAQNKPSLDITINGSSFSQPSGFYDPGPDFDCRLNVTVNGGVKVNKITYKNPQEIVINISTVGTSRGKKKVTVINPDGQSVTQTILDVITGSICR